MPDTNLNQNRDNLITDLEDVLVPEDIDTILELLDKEHEEA